MAQKKVLKVLKGFSWHTVFCFDLINVLKIMEVMNPKQVPTIG